MFTLLICTFDAAGVSTRTAPFVIVEIPANIRNVVLLASRITPCAFILYAVRYFCSRIIMSISLRALTSVRERTREKHEREADLRVFS